jgi:hypothetical protein
MDRARPPALEFFSAIKLPFFKAIDALRWPVTAAELRVGCHSFFIFAGQSVIDMRFWSGTAYGEKMVFSTGHFIDGFTQSEDKI